MSAISPSDERLTDEVYALLEKLPRLNHETPSSQLPSNGIYVFFERGELIRRKNTVRYRIVRVGTHSGHNRFQNRIRQHYGRVRSLGGNKNTSVFRKHVGGALLRKSNPRDPRLQDWLEQDGPSFDEIEQKVSCALRKNFTFSCFSVDRQEERAVLERGLIALLAQRPLGTPSANWLGRFAASEEVRRSGLWNSQHVNGWRLTHDEFRRLSELVSLTLGKG
jgi:hypothetical protein